MATKIRVEFFSPGFAGVLCDPGVVAQLNSVAAKRKAQYESQTGEAYRTRQSAAWDGRPRVIVSAATGKAGRVSNLTHEQWMSELWPKVGGSSWRPKH